jgi:hypothetical protein
MLILSKKVQPITVICGEDKWLYIPLPHIAELEKKEQLVDTGEDPSVLDIPPP